MTKLTPFDYAKSIDTQVYLDDLSAYSAYIINKKLSFSPATIFYANEMNMNSGLDPKLQYDYLFNSIRPNKRRPYTKWIKKSKDKDVEVVREYFGYNATVAKDVLRVITPEQLKTIKELLIKAE